MTPYTLSQASRDHSASLARLARTGRARLVEQALPGYADERRANLPRITMEAIEAADRALDQARAERAAREEARDAR